MEDAKKYRILIRLDKLSEVKDFVNICSKLPAGAKVQIVDETSNQRINATSLLGVISTVDWKETYVESAEDIYDSIKQFIPVTNLTN